MAGVTGEGLGGGHGGGRVDSERAGPQTFHRQRSSAGTGRLFGLIGGGLPR